MRRVSWWKEDKTTNYLDRMKIFFTLHKWESVTNKPFKNFLILLDVIERPVGNKLIYKGLMI